MNTIQNETPVAAPEGSRDHPILFSAPMVRAILDGRKTQTRRVARPRFDDRKPCEHWKGENHDGDATMYRHCSHGSEGLGCPYGSPGDRLWVRETFQMHSTGAGIRVTYRADGLDAWIEPPPTWCGIPDDNHWRPSIFMPRWASRITLAIADVRVERLNAISEDAAKAEGAERGNLLDGGDGFAEPCDEDEERDASYRQGFRHLWESINGRGSWISNPFVWVIEFTRVNTERSGSAT